MIANFLKLAIKESQSILECDGMGSTIAIIRITISLEEPNLQSLNYAVKNPACSIILWED